MNMHQIYNPWLLQSQTPYTQMDMTQPDYDWRNLAQQAPMMGALPISQVADSQYAPALLGLGAQLIGKGQDDKTQALLGGLPSLLGMFGGK